jgi:hypothetical protein
MKKLTKSSIRSILKIEAIFKRVQSLDKEIAQINKLAELVASKDTQISFNLIVLDKDEETKEKKKLQFDEDGSIILPGPEDVPQINPYTFPRMFGSIVLHHGYNSKPKEVKHKNVLKEDISVSICLKVLGVLLSEKYDERKQLITQLEEKGYTI